MTLFLPNGYKEFQDKCQLYEPKGKWDKDPDWLTKGFKQQNLNVNISDEVALLAWNLPGNFCPSCRSNTADPSGRCQTLFEGFSLAHCRGQCTPALGTFIFEEHRPDLHMKPGDVIRYQRCAKCNHDNLFGKNEASFICSKEAWEEAATREQENFQLAIEGKIKSLILAGERPIAEQHRY